MYLDSKEPRRGKQFNFTFNELLILLVVFALLALIIVPTARRCVKEIRNVNCQNSLLGLTRAGILYVSDYKRFFPAAIGNRFRWHGVRREDGNDADFNIADGPLFEYFSGREVPDMCPSLQNMIEDPDQPDIEGGGFGYGYNVLLGSRRCTTGTVDFWTLRCEKLGIKRRNVRKPSKTVMFTDTATKVDDKGYRQITGNIAEYSFADSFEFIDRTLALWGTPEPSVHFRHLNRANTVWADGHISQEEMTFSKDEWAKDFIGFIGKKDNSSYHPLFPNGKRK